MKLLSASDFIHFTKDQLNTLTTGANLLFNSPNEQAQKAPQVNIQRKKPSKVFGKTPKQEKPL